MLMRQADQTGNPENEPAAAKATEYAGQENDYQRLADGQTVDFFNAYYHQHQLPAYTYQAAENRHDGEK
jgi:hypothetical protein